MRSLDALSWPARRWLVDRLVGQHAYSRNVAVSIAPLEPSTSYSFTYGPSIRLRPHGQVSPVVGFDASSFDQESA